uniref:Amelogenin n=1 Tax=Gongylonema pulchrum TaxID=637853 RepID=A0A183EXU2_9BILA
LKHWLRQHLDSQQEDSTQGDDNDEEEDTEAG